MPRPERPLDPGAGPIPAFAVQLRQLRDNAGRPPYREMAKRAYRGYTTLAEAAAGRRFPSWEVTHAYVSACNGDLGEWKRRWRETADRLDSSGNGGGNGEGAPPRPGLPGPAGKSGVRPVAVDPEQAKTLPELIGMLNELREQAGLSLRELVDLSEKEAKRGAGSVLTRSDMSRFIRGTWSPRARDVLRIVELSGGTAADLRLWAAACDRCIQAPDDDAAAHTSRQIPAGGAEPAQASGDEYRITTVEREARPDGSVSDLPAYRYPPGGPTVPRLLLGARLRSLREAQGISTEQAGYEIRASHSKISRMELGRVGFKERDVADLLTLYGVCDPGERESLLDLAKQANKSSWWQQYGDVLPSSFEAYLGMEEAASLLRIYEVQLVPWLLQTEDYARAVIRRGHPGASDEEVERRVLVHETRKGRVASGKRLGGANAPRLWVVLDESVFNRRIGDRAVMRAQVESLIELSGQDGYCVQILPFGARLYPAGGSFTILRFAHRGLPDVVYLEQLAGATCLDRPADVDLYKRAQDSISAAATWHDSTVEHLIRILDDL